MSETILRELRSSDIDWLASVGQQVQLGASDILLEAGTIADAAYLIIEGQLALVSRGATADQTIAVLGSGDIVGHLFLSHTRPLPYRIQAQTPALVVKIPQSILSAQLEQDFCFSACFYRAVAQLLAVQHRQVVESLSRLALLTQPYQGKSIFSIFGSLQDSDMCWMLGAGTVQQLNQDEVCIQPGKSLEALYITLKGSLSISLSDRQHQPLALAFGVRAQPSDRKPIEQEVAQILPGEFVGISQFLDFQQNFYTIRANQNALVLSIPLAALQQKMQQDTGFTTRLYRAFASLMSDRIDQIFNAIHYREVCYECGDSLQVDARYGDEMGMEELQQISLARARFNWLLRQLKIKE